MRHLMRCNRVASARAAPTRSREQHTCKSAASRQARFACMRARCSHSSACSARRAPRPSVSAARPPTCAPSAPSRISRRRLSAPAQRLLPKLRRDALNAAACMRCPPSKLASRRRSRRSGGRLCGRLCGASEGASEGGGGGAAGGGRTAALARCVAKLSLMSSRSATFRAFRCSATY